MNNFMMVFIPNYIDLINFGKVIFFYSILDFLKVKHGTKRKKKDEDKSFHNPQPKY